MGDTSGTPCDDRDSFRQGFQSVTVEIIHPRKNDPKFNPSNKPFEKVKEKIIDKPTKDRIINEISTPLLALLLLKKKDGTLDYQAIQKLGINLTKVGVELAEISNRKVSLPDVKRSELLEKITEILGEILLRC